MDSVAPPRPSIMESPWFWVHLFAAGALVALFLINNKADVVQAQRDDNFARRQHSLELQAGQSTAADSGGTRFVTFTPFYALFGAAAAISWVMLWRQRLRSDPRRTTDPQ